MKELNFEQMAQVQGGDWCMTAKDMSMYSLEELMTAVYWNGGWWLDSKNVCP